jgi:hypothetical protein
MSIVFDIKYERGKRKAIKQLTIVESNRKYKPKKYGFSPNEIIANQLRTSLRNGGYTGDIDDIVQRYLQHPSIRYMNIDVLVKVLIEYLKYISGVQYTDTKDIVDHLVSIEKFDEEKRSNYRNTVIKYLHTIMLYEERSS